MKLPRTTSALVFFFSLLLVLGLFSCNNRSETDSQNKTNGIELAPPPSPSRPSRPGKPAPDTDQPARQQVAGKGTFTPHPALEKTLNLYNSQVNSNISSSLFPFHFEQPGEMAPPRQLTFSGVLNTSLPIIDFPVFELQIWSNNTQDTAPVYSKQLPFEEELQGVYSFQLTTPHALASGLYYYLVKDDSEKLYFANKVIVDY